MNLLIFDPAELEEANQLATQGGALLRVRGERAKELFCVSKVQPGHSLRVGEYDGRLGQAQVLAASKEEILLQIELWPASIKQPLADAIVALPRPQILKKVLELSAMLGLGRLHVVMAERSEKSYAQSPVLGAEQIRRYFRKGLEQSIATRPPAFVFYRNFKLLSRALQAEPLSSKLRFVAEPKAGQQLFDLSDDIRLNMQEIPLIAIGPEAGWSSEELRRFTELGFQSFSLGERILRVEFALCFVLGQLQFIAQRRV